MGDQTIHVAFMGGELNSVSVVEGTVPNVAERTMAKVRTFGHLVTRVGGTWDANNVSAEVIFDVIVDAGGEPMPWRHHFRRADAPWSMVTAL